MVSAVCEDVPSKVYVRVVDGRKLLIRLARGELANVAFGDAR
jgi:hypothetical protein